MSKYTSSLYNYFKNQVAGDDDNFKKHYKDLFDFNFQFYADKETLKNEFIEQFCEFYLFDEIATETIELFKIKLKNKLNLIMPKYSDLWKAKEQYDDVFVYRKYDETFTGQTNDNGNSNTSSNSTSSATATDSETFENESTTVSTGSATASDKTTATRSDTPTVPISSDYYSEKNITDVANNHTTSDNSTANDESTRRQSKETSGSDTSTSATTTANTSTDSSERHITETSGNYATLSAEFLAKVNSFNNMIIDECNELFMQIL